MRKRVVILASGAGSLTQAILDATELDIQIVAVVSDKSDAQVLERAKKANISGQNAASYCGHSANHD